jgi:hypothetical protein
MQADAELRDIPIAVISSIEGSQYAALLPDDAQLPVDAWISKPVDPDQLLGTVQRLLGKS